MNHDFCVHDGDLFGHLCPFCFNHGMCWTKEEKEPSDICGFAEMQGTVCGGIEVDVTAIGSTNIYIHPLCYSNYRFSSKCDGKECLHIVSLGISAVEAHISAELKYLSPPNSPSQKFWGWKSLIGLWERMKEEEMKIGIERRRRERKEEHERHKNRQIVSWWQGEVGLQELQCSTVSVCSTHPAITKILLCRL